MRVVLALVCVLLLLLLYVFLREALVLRAFLNFASISRGAVEKKLSCTHTPSAAYDALERHVRLRSGCKEPSYACWRRSVANASTRELFELGASWCS